MSKMRSDAAKPVGAAIGELIASLGIKQKLQEYDAVINWPSAVGEQIAKVTSAARISKGILIVNVKTGTWRNELVLRKKEIIEKLNKEIGLNVVKDIKFQ